MWSSTAPKAAQTRQVEAGVMLVQGFCSLLRCQRCKWAVWNAPCPQERKQFDERFVKMETKKLCELTSAADSLEMRPLVDMASRALARLIEGKSPEEIREAFNLPDDLTEEEKLEPVKNLIDDPRIRLLNRLYAKKRKVRTHAVPAGSYGPLAGPASLHTWHTLWQARD